MPKLSVKLPRYRRHSARDVAFVEVGGRRTYLPGGFNSAESKQAYRRFLVEWESQGRPSAPPPPENELTIAELLVQYLRFAKGYYLASQEVENIVAAVRLLKELYGRTPAAEFGPLKLKAVRDKMIASGNSRTGINGRIGRIKRMFKWGVENELVPPAVLHGLQAVGGLRFGHTTAKETEPVKPVPEAFVDAVKPHVLPPVWTMIELQRCTGMRPGEVATMRTCDIDVSGSVWVYKPAHHKNRHRGHTREIYLGPRAQAVLKPWLKLDLQAFLFSPRDAVAQLRVERTRARRTPASCGNRVGSNRKPKPQRVPGEHYSVLAYRIAIQRACRKANVPEWSPHQLRHNAGTWLRKEFGLDTARVILGHKSPAVTAIYAEADTARAVEVMGKIG